jgi:uncharacterized membrane protein YdjX (TVP38/TMEM64 family)
VATCTILADLRRGLLSDETPRKIMPTGKTFLSLVLVAAIITTAFVAYKTIDLPALASTAQECKEQYPMTVMLATIGFATVWSLLLPTTPIELLMGYLFGIAQGWAINYFCKFLSSTISYVLGRTVLRAWLHGLWLSSAKHELLSAFEAEVSERPFSTAFLMRVAYVPISIKNYGMALIGVPTAAFYAAFFSVEFFESYLLIALGAGAKDLHELLSGQALQGEQKQAWVQLGLLGLEVAMLVVLLVHLGDLANKAVERRRAQQQTLADDHEDDHDGGGGSAGSSGLGERSAGGRGSHSCLNSKHMI